MEETFDKDADGNIIAFPLTGFALRTAGGIALILRVTYEAGEPPPGAPAAQIRAIQFALSPQIAMALTEQFLSAVQTILRAGTSGSPRN